MSKRKILSFLAASVMLFTVVLAISFNAKGQNAKKSIVELQATSAEEVLDDFSSRLWTPENSGSCDLTVRFYKNGNFVSTQVYVGISSDCGSWRSNMMRRINNLINYNGSIMDSTPIY